MLESNYFPTDDTMLELLCKQYEKLEDGLVFGKAGLAIYYARLSNESPAYKKMYNRLTDDLLSKVSGKTPIELTRGLLGIALALDFIMCYFKPGNPDIVLDDVDAVIYKNLDKGRDMKPLDLTLAVEGLLYLSMHLKYGIRCSSKRRIYCRKAINLLNDICLAMPIDFFQEPIPSNMFNRSAFLLYAIGNLYEQRIETQRIEHICNDLIYQLGTNVPIFQFTRLERLFVVTRLIKLGCAKGANWHEYQELLLNSLSLKELFNEECPDNQLTLSDGLTGAVFLMLGTNKYSETPIFDVPWNFYCARLEQCTSLTQITGNDMPLYKNGINWLWGMKTLLRFKGMNSL